MEHPPKSHALLKLPKSMGFQKALNLGITFNMFQIYLPYHSATGALEMVDSAVQYHYQAWPLPFGRGPWLFRCFHHWHMQKLPPWRFLTLWVLDLCMVQQILT